MWRKVSIPKWVASTGKFNREESGASCPSHITGSASEAISTPKIEQGGVEVGSSAQRCLPLTLFLQNHTPNCYSLTMNFSQTDTVHFKRILMSKDIIFLTMYAVLLKTRNALFWGPTKTLEKLITKNILNKFHKIEIS